MSEPAKLDVTGLLCPLPVIRTQDAIKHLAPGQHLHVIASDPGTLHDIPAWCRVHGHQIRKTTTDDEIYTFVICVGEDR